MQTLFLVFTPEFVEIRKEDVCVLVRTLEFEVLTFLCPSKFVYAPPQSRYPGAGPVLKYLSLIALLDLSWMAEFFY